MFQLYTIKKDNQNFVIIILVWNNLSTFFSSFFFKFLEFFLIRFHLLSFLLCSLFRLCQTNLMNWYVSENMFFRKKLSTWESQCFKKKKKIKNFTPIFTVFTTEIFLTQIQIIYLVKSDSQKYVILSFIILKKQSYFTSSPLNTLHASAFLLF